MEDALGIDPFMPTNNFDPRLKVQRGPGQPFRRARVQAVGIDDDHSARYGGSVHAPQPEPCLILSARKTASAACLHVVIARGEPTWTRKPLACCRLPRAVAKRLRAGCSVFGSG